MQSSLPYLVGFFMFLVLQGGGIIKGLIPKNGKGKQLIFSITNFILVIVYINLTILSPNYRYNIYRGIVLAGVVLINLLLILHFKFENKRNTKDNRKRYLINYKSLIREQRHDYMNILQIVYGYIQLNKKDKAIEYVDRTTKMSTVISKLYRLSILSFSLFIDKKIREFYNEGIEVLCDVKNETDLEFREAKEEESIVLRLNKILDIVKDYSIQSDDKEIIMGIYEYNNGIDIVISKSMESTVIKNIRKIHDEVYTNNKELMISFKFNSVYNLNSNKTDVSNILYNS
ncbi:hypothetical protein BET03_11295 [Thermohalobacter berrensis]|uniref:SpoOB alpha-helical domain-containing protein n=1 Tax=Thermohalobacter berrensis TaxID=99594 RepID=A0A419T4L6_9FIRM|nr:hypothetical protein BET03_11295 [Thermohalobacter berrensis]